MIMPDLPHDILEDILSRVPATSLKPLRYTCKLWNALFKDQGFTNKHFRVAPKQSLVLMLKERRVVSTSVNLNIGAPSVEYKGALVLKDSHYNSQQVDISNISNCDGLLLCTTKNNRLVVWNPCLGETKWIQFKTGDQRHYRFALGYVNDKKSCRSYKILRWYNDDDKVVGPEIYEFGSDSWRIVDPVAFDCFILLIQQNDVSLKGNAYWIASEKLDTYEQFLLCFDFTRERFRRLCVPTFQGFCWIALSVVREEQLSVLRWCFGESKIEIWVASKIDAKAALWSKCFTVDFHSNFLQVPLSFMFDKEKKVVVCCNNNLEPTSGVKYTIEKYYTEDPFVEITQVSWCPFIFNYVPSLVQIE